MNLWNVVETLVPFSLPFSRVLYSFIYVSRIFSFPSLILSTLIESPLKRFSDYNLIADCDSSIVRA